MPDWLSLIIMALATWRIATMFVVEDGPFDCFRRLRSLFGIIHDNEGAVAMIPDNTMAKLFSCLWCMSIWIAGVVYLLWIIIPILVWVLAISTSVIIIDRIKG